MYFKGHGNYTELDVDQLPPLFLAYCPDPSDSGRIHSNVKQRWLNNEPEVVEGMQKFREITTQARSAIEEADWEKLHQLMTENFEQRRKLYGGNNGESILIMPK